MECVCEGILAFEGGSRNKGTKGPKDWTKDDEEGEGVFYLLSWGGLRLGALHLLECLEVAAKLIASLVSDSSAGATPSPTCFFPPSPPSH
ncbi:hypothetical protein MUK42_25889 [Musa troglodytarum]|uniref:Uncharacterized protein n=1 Tax=Musa troglodytarum TaxID=320322 RepID=A0A9E7E938_9LILI|nr:hypothetical protein MUK42_25889 [Musa troglodytarum]